MYSFGVYSQQAQASLALRSAQKENNRGLKAVEKKTQRVWKESAPLFAKIKLRIFHALHRSIGFVLRKRLFTEVKSTCENMAKMKDLGEIIANSRDPIHPDLHLLTNDFPMRPAPLTFAAKDQGKCFGASAYACSRFVESPTEETIALLCSEFEGGVPIGAAIFHKLGQEGHDQYAQAHGGEAIFDDELDLRSYYDARLVGAGLRIDQGDYNAHQVSLSVIEEVSENLPPGAYLIQTPVTIFRMEAPLHHVMALLVTDEGTRYLFDSNAGIGKIDSITTPYRVYGNSSVPCTLLGVEPIPTN